VTETIRIPLGPSGSPVAWTTVDLVDYERLIIHRWYLSGRGYAFRAVSGKSTFMHREVLGFPDSEDVDHINRDKLDNRRANLEACTHAHNVRVGRGATVLPKRERIRELRLDGWQNQAIADELGITVANVSKYASDLPKAPDNRIVWTRERLIGAVRDFHGAHGRVPSQVEFDGKNGMPWFSVVYRRFPGGVLELREAAGFGRVDLRSAVA